MSFFDRNVNKMLISSRPLSNTYGKASVGEADHIRMVREGRNSVE